MPLYQITTIKCFEPWSRQRKGTWLRTLQLFSSKWDTFKTIVIKKNIGYKWTKYLAFKWFLCNVVSPLWSHKHNGAWLGATVPHVYTGSPSLVTGIHSWSERSYRAHGSRYFCCGVAHSLKWLHREDVQFARLKNNKKSRSSSCTYKLILGLLIRTAGRISCCSQ